MNGTQSQLGELKMSNAQKYVDTVLFILETCDSDDSYTCEVSDHVLTLKYDDEILVETTDVGMVKYHIDTNEDNKMEAAHQRGCIPS